MAIRIVLADHHPIVRQDLAALLAAEPDMVVVGEAGDTPTIFKLLHNLSPHMVIMDISMPDLNAVDVTQQILTKFPQTKVIALSMHADSLFVLNMLKAGASGYLLKDCAVEELAQAVRAAGSQQVFVSSGIVPLPPR